MSAADDETSHQVTPEDAETAAGEPNPPAVDAAQLPEPEPQQSPAAPSRGMALAQSLWRRIPVTNTLFWAYLVIFGVVMGLGWPLWQQHRLASAEAAGQRAAVNYAEVLTSIDSDKVDDDFAAVLNGATGQFKDTYSKASVQLRQLLIDNKAAAKGTVMQSAVQSGSTNTVVVLLMVNQSVTNTARPDPRIDRSRMKMTMDKVDGRWLASKVELP